MGADQALIQGVSKMGPSRFRDDSGFINALGSIGKYIATKKQIMRNATDGFNAAAEDIDIESLAAIQTEVDGLLKTISKVPAFMPKYKKARNRYNELLKVVESSKETISAFAAKRLKIGSNISDISVYQSAGDTSIDADVMVGAYTTRIDPNAGPIIIFQNGSEMLMEEYVNKQPHLKSESKTNNDLINTLADKYGGNAKRNNEEYSANSVKTAVSHAVEDLWINGNDKQTILYNTKYQTPEGEMTFMDYYAKKNPGFVETLNRLSNPESEGQFMDWSEYDVPSDAYLEESANVMKVELWGKNTEGAIKSAYKEFLEKEVILHDYETNSGKSYNAQGKVIKDGKLYVGKSLFDGSNLHINEQVVRSKAENLMNPKLGDIENWWEGKDIRYKAVPMRPSTSSGQAAQGVVTDPNTGEPIIGWVEIDQDDQPIGNVKLPQYMVKNEFNIQLDNIKTSKIIQY